MSLWNRTGLTEILGQPAGTTIRPPLADWGSGRTALYWRCGGDGAAIEASENPDMENMSLRVSCEDPDHRELEDYCTIRVSDVVVLGPKMSGVTSLPAEGRGYSLQLNVVGPPALRMGLQLVLRGESGSSCRGYDLANVGTYQGSQAQFLPVLFFKEPGQVKLTLHAIRTDIYQANPAARGLILWSGYLQVLEKVNG